MPKRPSRRRAFAVVFLTVLLAASAAGAETPEPATVEADGFLGADDPADLPSGFTDGVPVGDWDDDPDVDEPMMIPDDDGSGPAIAADPGDRYIGKGPWDQVRHWSSNVARPSGCSVSADDLTAMVFAPMFKESSGATTAGSVGSPMTLSRYDEWLSGVRNGTSNGNANYGLYENEDPYTPYPRAYWHPGIGLWQYDSAGVGAPFTAAERIDVGVIGEDVVRSMMTRYCNSSGSSSFDKRRAAWSPWLETCTTSNAAANLCEQQFRNMMDTSPRFARVKTVAGVSATGGMLKRRCTVNDTSHDCWYVDPARAEGTKSWQFTPDGGLDPKKYPAPLSYPFYVVKRNGREERHWLREDTGYPVDIHATRQLGKNARPRTNGFGFEGSGLTWARTSTLCDLDTDHGDCGDPDRAKAFGIAATIDFLGRYPGVGELNRFASEPFHRKAARARLVNELANSEEWVAATVNRFYLDTLGRPGDPAGLEHWTGRIRSGEATVAEVAAEFYASGEYYRKFGGDTIRGWVEDLYVKLLLRNPANDQGGVDHWVAQTGAKGRRSVARSFYQTDESRRTRVKLLYQALLKRDPDPGGLTHWASRIRTAGDISLAAELAASAEYYNRAWNRFG